MKKLEFNFYKDYDPEEMLRRLTAPTFREVQKSALQLKGYDRFSGAYIGDVEVSFGFFKTDSLRYGRGRSEYETIIYEDMKDLDQLLDNVMEYILDNIDELILLLKLN